MSGLLSFHRMAAARGDGLHPRLRDLLEAREQMGTTAGAVVDISTERRNHMVQAGPNPVCALPRFLPGNVVRFERGIASAATAHRKSSSSAT
jgi:hypothetical protein